MGVSYYAGSYVGIELFETDLMDVTTKTISVCDHPEAEGAKFCPVCGVREDQRQKTITVKTWKPHLKVLFEDYEDFDELLCDAGVDVGGLHLWAIRTSSDNPRVILGERLAWINAEGGYNKNPNPTVKDAINLVGLIHKIQDIGLGLLGISTRPQLFTVSYVSV